MTILDENSVPSYAVLGGMGVFLTLVSAGILVAESLQDGLIVLSAPIAVGAFVLAAREYRQRDRSEETLTEFP